MISPTQALGSLPAGLRDPLLAECRYIIQNFMERKWLPSELSGGRFCEIVYTILHDHATGSYSASPAKPNNFANACRQLENNAHVPRSFQILIPRLLPALYEIRNNRGVGHIGGEVNPNYMDATAVLSMANWIMAELVRVFHQLPTDDAQKVVDSLVERRIPVVWQIGEIRRVLDTSLKLKDQVLLLICSCSAPVASDDLYTWTGYKDRGYFNRLLRSLHDSRFIELSADENTMEILPPGTKYVEDSLLPTFKLK
ncbi:hypothetical protein L0337_30330 [candidate division KSB1 bacterium]|nr:hypothetical protein [candidate division KSB1 bacterium]